MKTADQLAMILSNRIKDCISKHMAGFTSAEYKEMIASTIMALYLETARLKWLCVSTGEVDPDEFNVVFLNGIEKHFTALQDRYGTTSQL